MIGLSALSAVFLQGLAGSDRANWWEASNWAGQRAALLHLTPRHQASQPVLRDRGEQGNRLAVVCDLDRFPLAHTPHGCRQVVPQFTYSDSGPHVTTCYHSVFGAPDVEPPKSSGPRGSARRSRRSRGG